MENNRTLKIGYRVDNREGDMWCLGIGLAHFVKETYVYINLFKWSISIGYLYDDNYDCFVNEF